MVDLNIFDLNKKNKKGDNILHLTAKNNQITSLKYFVQLNTLNLNEKNVKGDTVLHILADNNNNEIFKYFASLKEVKINSKNRKGNTVLNTILERHHSTENHNIFEFRYNDPFRSKTNDKETLKFLIELDRFDPKKISYRSNINLLDFSCLFGCNLKAIQKIVETNYFDTSSISFILKYIENNKFEEISEDFFVMLIYHRSTAVNFFFSPKLKLFFFFYNLNYLKIKVLSCDLYVHLYPKIITIIDKAYKGKLWNKSNHHLLPSKDKIKLETFLFCNKKMGVYKMPPPLLSHLFSIYVSLNIPNYNTSRKKRELEFNDFYDI